MPHYTIRKATINDAPLIAKAVAMAIGDETILHNYAGENYLEVFTTIAQTPNTQYSYTNALIAETTNAQAIGVVIGYDGAKLHTLKQHTLKIVFDHTHHTPTIADEADTDEFYIDTIAVLPQFRNNGIGQNLLKTICNEALSQQHQRIGLIVDLTNPKAEKLYTSIGFKHIGYKTFFTHKMKHLQLQKQTTTT